MARLGSTTDPRQSRALQAPVVNRNYRHHGIVRLSQFWPGERSKAVTVPESPVAATGGIGRQGDSEEVPLQQGYGRQDPVMAGLRPP